MASVGLGAFFANFLQGMTTARQAKKDKEEEEKRNSVMTEILEIQKLTAEQKLNALTTLMGAGSAPQPIPPSPLLADRTGAMPPTPARPQPSLVDMLADPDKRMAMIQSELFPQFAQMHQFEQQQGQVAARSRLATAIRDSGLPPGEALRRPDIGALAIEAGVGPQEFMEAESANGGYRPTANIQDFMFSRENPNFLPFLREAREAQAGGTGLGKADAGAYEQIQAAGMTANRTINMYGRMSELNDMIESGRLAPATTLVAELAESLGVNVEGLDATQAFRALSNRVALELRNPSGGAGMPGAMSDADRDFLMKSVPGLTLTEEGNKLLIDYATRMAQRDRAVWDKARAYRRENGSIDEGFFDELQEWSDANPIFGEEEIEETEEAVSDDGWAIVD